MTLSTNEPALPSEPSPYLTLKEAARLVGRADRTLREWRQSGLIQTVRIGRSKLVLRSEILKLMEGK